MKGVQTPRVHHSPPRDRSLGRQAVQLAAEAGLYLDAWQRTVLEETLGVRGDGSWSAFEVGLVVSRQNGKGSILEALELAGLFLLGEKLIIHSAHQFDTSLEAFQRILQLVENSPVLDSEVKRVSRSHGEEGIELKSGQRLRFRTRTKGGGRGFTCDRLILDEAMYLTSTAVSALLPTLSARPNPQVIYAGSAGDKESTHLGRIRERALRGDDPRLCYLEWSIDPCTDYCPPELRNYKCPEHDPIDQEISYAKANPALNIRVSTEHVEGEFRSMDEETFLRERLGVGDWPVEGESWRVISEYAWEQRLSEVNAPQMPFAFALEVNPERTWSCIAVAGRDGDEGVPVEITQDSSGQPDYRPGTRWAVKRLIDLHRKWKPIAVVVDKAGQAGHLIPELEAAKIEIVSPTSREYAQACGAFYSGIVPGKGNTPWIWHQGQEPLTAAVRGAAKRDMAGLWAWDRRNASVDISPLIAATHAQWGLHKMTNTPQAVAPWAMLR